jgi:hypothetical protein
MTDLLMNEMKLPRAAMIGLLVLAASGPTAIAQTPEESKMYEAQHKLALADAKARADALQRQRDARKADPMAWVRTLDPIASGGWQFRAVAPDGTWAAFSTDHQMKRSGKTMIVWLRQEYPEAQHGPNGETFLSNVEKVQYDCSKARARALTLIYYSENNIGGSPQSEEQDPKQAPWESIVPGTQTETIFQWACAQQKAG